MMTTVEVEDKEMQQDKVQIQVSQVRSVRLTHSKVKLAPVRNKVATQGLQLATTSLSIGLVAGFVTLLVRPSYHVLGFGYGTGVAALIQLKKRNTLR